MKELTYMYVLIDNKNKTHYGVYDDDQEARKKATQYEDLNNLSRGQIDIYEIPSWEFHFRGQYEI